MKARASQSVEYIDLKHINLIETKHNVEIWPEIRNIMLRGRFAKKKKKKKMHLKKFWASLNWCGVCGRILALHELVDGAQS